MKKFLLFALAGLALVGCKDGDNKVKKNSQNDISFATQTSMMRADDVTSSTLKSFHAYVLKPNATNTGDEFYFQTDVTKGVDGWTYDPVQQWLGDAVLKFYAFSPSTTTFDKAKLTLSFTPESKAKDQKDLVVASLASAQAAKAVMPFKHALSKIVVKAKNSGSSYDVEIAGIRLTNFYSDGTVKYAAAATPAPANLFSWEDLTDAKKISKFFTSPKTAGDVVAVNVNTTTAVDLNFGQGAFMVIPQDLSGANKWIGDDKTADNNKKARLSFLLRVKKHDTGVLLFPGDKEKFGWGACSIETNFLAGKKYTITLDFAKGAGIQDPDDDTDDATPVTPVKPTPKPNTPVVSSNDIIFDVDITDFEDGGEVNIGL